MTTQHKVCFWVFHSKLLIVYPYFWQASLSKSDLNLLYVFVFFFLNLTPLGLYKKKMHHNELFKERYLTLWLSFFFCVYNLILWCTQTHDISLWLCLLLKVQPWNLSLLLYVISSAKKKRKKRATGALTPNSTTLPSLVFLSICNVWTKETLGSCLKISCFEKTVDFILENF